MKLTTDILKKMVRSVQMTTQQEIGCGECFEQLEQFAGMKLKGKAPEEAMPLVQDHLKKCNDCREEYEALLDAMEELGNPA